MNFSPIVKNREVLMSRVPSMHYIEGDFAAWQVKAREELSSLLGMNCFKPCDANFVLESKAQKDGYTEYTFTINTEETFKITSTFLVPNSAKKPPLLISVYGDSDDLAAALGYSEEPDRDVCVAACKAGYATLALKARSFDDCPALNSKRVPLGQDIRATWNQCYRSTMRASILGRITMGERVWDISRMIDAVASNFDNVDIDNITLIGNSGGGTLAYYAAAIDQRITTAICSSGIAEWEDSIAKIAMCSCNFIPLIANSFKISDISGLIAPRNLKLLSYTNDYWFTVESAKCVYRSAASLYSAAGSDKISFEVIEGDPLLTSSTVLKILM